MSDKTLQDLKVDAHIAVLHTKVDALIEKQKELTARVRANEKVVAAVTLLGTVVLAVIGTGYFAPKAEAHHWPTSGELIERIREWESEQKRTPIDIDINSAIDDYQVTKYQEEFDYGCDGSAEQEELLQLPSSEDRQSTGRGHDRCDDRPGVRPLQEGESEDCWSGHAREENEGLGGEGTWVGCDELVKEQT